MCGLADAEYGQVVGAVVVIKSDAPACLTPADIVAYARTKVASHATPRRVVFVRELPVNAMGKVRSSRRAGANSCVAKLVFARIRSLM